MDLILYCLVIGVVGLVRQSKTRNVPDDVGVVSMGGTVSMDYDLPVGNNFLMWKEPEAYTLILQELGLK